MLGAKAEGDRHREITQAATRYGNDPTVRKARAKAARGQFSQATLTTRIGVFHTRDKLGVALVPLFQMQGETRTLDLLVIVRRARGRFLAR